MGRKFKCDFGTSSNCNPCSSSSSSMVYCCKKYPKCKCSPIYYPNNCNPYPCNPCAPKICPPNPCGPCGPFPPYPPFPCPPPPCAPNTCAPFYTSNPTIGTSSTSLAVTSPTVNLYNMATSGQTITLPAISMLGTCNYTKQFVIGNQVTSSNTFAINPTSPDGFYSTPITALAAGQTVILYAVYVSGGTSFWIAVQSISPA